MKKLSKDWLTEGLIDFEYKKLLLLAYFQQVDALFGQHLLYPTFAELVDHYRHLKDVETEQQRFREQLRKVADEHPDDPEAAYRRLLDDDDVMREIEEIVSYSIPAFGHYLSEGKAIYQYVEENLHISPVGVVPIRTDEGYFFVVWPQGRNLDIFSYRITIFEQADETYRGIHVRFLETTERSLVNTPENVKIGLTRRFRELPNPAAYLVETQVVCPLYETLLPVAKRSLVRYLATSAA